MRTCLAAFFILVVTPVLSGEQVRHLDVVLDGCQTLDACIKNLDAALQPTGSGRVYGDEPKISEYLMRFGEAGKQELLKRATGGNPAWRNLAGALLMTRHDFTQADVPMLARALRVQPGGWVAHPLAEIGTPEAVRVLADDVTAHGYDSQSGHALATFGAKALPYVWPMFQDDIRWIDGAKLLKNVGTGNVDSMQWAAVAIDRTQPKRSRIAALRIIRTALPNSSSAGPTLYPLLNDADKDIQSEALDTLRPMGDIVVLAYLMRRCNRQSDPVAELREPYLCLEEIAAYGQSVQPFGGHLADIFLGSTNGMDRADGASLLGYVGYAAAIPRLIMLLSDKDWRVAYASARALGWLAANDAVTALDRIAATHWLPFVRDMARQSRDAITSSRNLPKPPVHAASNGFPARVDLAVDKNVLAAPQLCASNAWQWQGRRIVFPEHTENGVEVWNDKVTIQPAGRLPGGEFYVVRAGEYAWVEFKPRRGRAVKIQDAGVNGLLQVKDGVIAVFPGPASRTTFTDKDGNVIEYPKETVIIGDVDFTGLNYAMKFSRDAKGAWHGHEIARFVRGAGIPVTFGPDLFAAGFDDEVIVFSQSGILGLAECVPS